MVEWDLDKWKSVSEMIVKKEDGHVFPYPWLIFRAFELTTLENVKLVVVGQDPYPNTDSRHIPFANGLAFSTNSKEMPKSLDVLYRMCKNDLGVELKKDFTEYAKRGVLFLNSSLTVRPFKPNSHKKYWKGFLFDIVSQIEAAKNDVVYLCFGKESYATVSKVVSDRHRVVFSLHPASRVKYDNIAESKCFLRVCNILGYNIFNLTF